MKEYLTAGSQFSEYILEASESAHFFLFVEGDDDRKLLSEHVAGHLVLRKIEGGKSTALELAAVAARNQFSRMKVLVDQDFDFLDGSYPTSGVLLKSRTHDVFTDIATSNPAVLSKVVRSYVDTLRRRRVGPPADVDAIEPRVIRKALEIARPVTMVRIAAQSLKLDVRFRGFNFREFAESISMTVDAVVLQLQKNGAIPGGDQRVYSQLIENAIEWDTRWDENALTVVGDHDMFSALSVSLSHEGIQSSRNGLHFDFINATSCHHLRNVEWFTSIGAWSRLDGKPGFTCATEGHCDIGVMAIAA
ncbi:MAG: hypothetical protein L0G62_00190 [Micrococcaceae bacterium]|nr:hypothetical protein [Micrococcaceae bacterium]